MDDVYEEYLRFCQQTGLPVRNKQDFVLRTTQLKELMVVTATRDGQPVEVFDVGKWRKQ